MPKIVPDGTNAVRLLALDRTRPPSQQFFVSITVQRDPANTGKYFVGFPPPKGVGGGVSSTSYDAVLDENVPGVAIEGEPCASIDASLCWGRPEISGEGGSWFGGVKS